MTGETGPVQPWTPAKLAAVLTEAVYEHFTDHPGTLTLSSVMSRMTNPNSLVGNSLAPEHCNWPACGALAVTVTGRRAGTSEKRGLRRGFLRLRLRWCGGTVPCPGRPALTVGRSTSPPGSRRSDGQISRLTHRRAAARRADHRIPARARHPA